MIVLKIVATYLKNTRLLNVWQVSYFRGIKNSEHKGYSNRQPFRILPASTCQTTKRLIIKFKNEHQEGQKATLVKTNEMQIVCGVI